MQVVPPSIEIVFADEPPARLQMSDDVIHERIDEDVSPSSRPPGLKVQASPPESDTLEFSSAPPARKSGQLITPEKRVLTPRSGDPSSLSPVRAAAPGEAAQRPRCVTKPEAAPADTPRSDGSSPGSVAPDTRGTGLLVQLSSAGPGEMASPTKRSKPKTARLEDTVQIQLSIPPGASELAKLKLLPSHPHIVSVIDVRRCRTSREHIADLCTPGTVRGTLREWLDNTGPLPPPVAAGASLQIARALHCLHSHGLVHMDVRPTNMLVVFSGGRALIKLLCAGVLQLLPTAPELPEGLLGALGHVPPEVLRGDPVSAASNVWSLGSCLSELLTGRPPFGSLAPATAVQRTLSEQHPPLPPRLDKGAVEFLTGCWAHAPQARLSAALLVRHKFVIDGVDFCDHTAASYTATSPEPEPAGGPSSRPPAEPRAAKPRAPRKARPKEQEAAPEPEPAVEHSAKKRAHPRAVLPASVEERYTVERELGRGSFGVVMLGKENEGGGLYAIKLIKGLVTREQKELAIREARVLKAAKSVHVVQVKEVVEEPTDVVIVMEYASGGVLQDYLDSRKVTMGQSRSLIEQILTAVDYLHCSLNIVHRDLKPENILMAELPSPDADPDEVPVLKLADFGLSTFFKSTKVMKSYCGTPCYLAPEVSKGGGYSRAVDLWSVGVMLFLTLMGELPPDNGFKPSSVESLPAAAADLIKQLLAPDPLVRITAKEALQHHFITGEAAELARPGLMTMLSEWRYSDDDASPLNSPKSSRKSLSPRLSPRR